MPQHCQFTSKVQSSRFHDWPQYNFGLIIIQTSPSYLLTHKQSIKIINTTISIIKITYHLLTRHIQRTRLHQHTQKTHSQWFKIFTQILGLIHITIPYFDTTRHTTFRIFNHTRMSLSFLIKWR
jgi:hypothetical protein